MVFCNIIDKNGDKCRLESHNPYFNRWFSAIKAILDYNNNPLVVTILILIDGFLQYRLIKISNYTDRVTILILIDGFLQ